MSPLSSYPVAMIPYVNMAPYRQMGTPPDCRFVPLVPRKSIAALADGSVVAAAAPVGGLPLLDGIVEPLGKFGIAAKKESMSVMFFSDRPLDAFDRNCTIRLTGDSASSVRLLFLLFTHLLGRDNLPGLAAAGKPANGELLIGDRAISRAGKLSDWGRPRSEEEKDKDPLPFVADLATVWNGVRGLPFVFARWVVRKDAAAEVKTILTQWLERFREQEAAMVAACIAPATRTLDIDTAAAKRYFQVIHRCLDDTDLLGQNCFLDEFQRVKQDPLFRHL